VRTAHELELTRGSEALPPVENMAAYAGQSSGKAKSANARILPARDDETESDEDDDYAITDRYKLLKRKLEWVLEDSKLLKMEMDAMEGRQKRIWVEKSLLFNEILEKEGIYIE